MAKKISNAGRKPISDKKVRVVFFLERSYVNLNGGMDEVKSECYLFLKERGQKSFKKKR